MYSFDPNAEKTCESLLERAFEIEPNNVEALISLSSFRLSQQRQDDAKEAAQRAWTAWKDLEDGQIIDISVFLFRFLILFFHIGDPAIPPIPIRIELTKRFIEVSEYSTALQILQTIMATDDQDVEAWYLEGWCFYLMAEQAKESGSKISELTWEELARDSRDCLENCQMVRLYSALSGHLW